MGRATGVHEESSNAEAWGSSQRALERALLKIQNGEPLISICSSGTVGIDGEGIAKLAGALAQQTQILSFQLRSNNIGDAGATRLASALERHNQLRRLDLADNSIGNPGILQLCRVLQPPCTSLRSLRLHDNRMGDEAASRLAAVLLGHPGLEELELGGNTISEAGAADVVKVMTQCQGLKALGLEQNALGNAGAGLLAEALQHGSSLERLNLGHNGMGDEGALHLAAALHRHSSLRELHLSDNRICDPGALAFARALQVHTGLRALCVERNWIGDDAVSELLTVLVRMSRDDVICNLAGNPSTRFDALSLSNLTVTALTVRSLSRRGMRLKHMLFLWKDGTGSGTIDEETTTTADFATGIVRPEMAKYDVCSAQFHHAPMADAYVIHPWNGLLRHLIQAVASHATGDPTAPLDPDHLLFLRTPKALESSYYIDVFTMDQNSSATSFGHPRCEADKFDLVLSEFQLRGAKVLLVADPNYLVLTRLWCLAEAQCAAQCSIDMEVGFGGMRPFPRKRRGTRMLDAEVSCPNDREWLLEGIGYRAGTGVEQFDATVTSLVEETFRTCYRQVFPLLPKHKQDELNWLEAQDNAREDLIAATADDNVKLLSKCIAVAEEVHIEQAPIRAAMRKRAALMLVESAELTKAALHSTREEAERTVMAGRRRLPELEYEERLEQARKQLTAALEGSKKMAVGWGGPVAVTESAVQALQQTLPEALEADVEEQMLAEATSRLAELLVVAACKRGDLSEMESALRSAAQSGGVPAAVFKAAQQKLARKRLAVSLESSDADALLLAVVFANEVGLDAEVVKAAHTRLAEMSPEAVQLAAFAGVLTSVLVFLSVGKATSLANVCTWLKPLPREASVDVLAGAIAALKQAIEMAEDASLGDTLEAARLDLGTLEHESRKRTARRDLLLCSRGDNLPRLVSCLAEAEEMGVEDVLLAVSRRKVAELELAAATQTGDADDLQESIESAKHMGVKRKCVEAAKEKLSQVDPAAYKRILCAEMMLACEHEDRDALRWAIALFVQAGGEGEEVSTARTRLSELELAAAAERGDIEGLRSAIAEALEAGVAELSVRAAKRKLAEVEMAAACEKTSIQGLIDSIERAMEVGVEGQHIAVAEGRLAKLQLVAAMKLREIDVLEKAVKKVEETDQTDENLGIARRRLAEWKLVALAAGDCGEDELRQALEAAGAEGVREAVMVAPRKRLLQLELASASSGESIAVLERALAAADSAGIEGEELLEAGRRQLVLLKMREAACEADAEALQEAIAAALQARVEHREIEAAKRKLAKLDPEAYKDCLLAELATTSAGTDADALARVIDAATKAGADADEIVPARQRLVELMVSAAAGAEDTASVKRAIAMAEAFEDEHSEEVPGLEAARARLAALEQAALRAAGHDRLLQAIEGGDIKELQSALAEARRLGVDQDVIEMARSRLD